MEAGEAARRYVQGWTAAWPGGNPDAIAAHCWAVLRAGGNELTLAGHVALRFAPDGRVAEDSWSMEEGHRSPPPGWGR